MKCVYYERVRKLRPEDCGLNQQYGKCPDHCSYMVVGADCEYTVMNACDICSVDYNKCQYLLPCRCGTDRERTEPVGRLMWQVDGVEHQFEYTCIRCMYQRCDELYELWLKDGAKGAPPIVEDYAVRDAWDWPNDAGDACDLKHS